MKDDDESDDSDSAGGKQRILMRVRAGEEFVKVILVRGRLRGAVLIGDTDLEETFQNFLLDGTDLRPFGDELLSPDVDLEDYFD